MSALRDRRCWRAPSSHHEDVKDLHLRELFAADPRRGERIKVSENRSMLHVALRMPWNRSLIPDGTDVVAQVHGVLDRTSAFSERVRSGQWKRHTGGPIKAIVNIGIGVSDPGAVMAYEALRHYAR